MNPVAKPGAVVFVHQLQRMLPFYREVTALTVVEQDARFVLLENAGLELVLHALPPQLAASEDSTPVPAPREDAAVKLVFPVADLAAARVAAACHGGRLGAPEQEWRWRGWRLCDGVDPEGNVIQLRMPETAPR